MERDSLRVTLPNRELIEFDVNDAVLNMRCIDANTRIRIVRRATGFSVERPSMPRADDVALLNQALAKRTTPVRADVIHHNQLSIDASNTEYPVPGSYLADLPIPRGF